MDAVTISPLAVVAQFRPIVTDRIFTAWGEAEGFTLDELDRDMARNMLCEAIPFTLVAHEGEAFLGTVSVIDDDLPLRPAIWPWLASLWVEPEARARGIGARLIAAALSRAAPHASDLHLHAVPDVAGFYESRGWTAVERDVSGVTIFRHPTRRGPAGA